MEDQLVIQQTQKPSEKALGTTGKGKVVLIGVGLLGLGTLAFFGWRKWGKQPDDGSTDDASTSPAKGYSLPAPKSSYSVPKQNSDFPLKRGSKGERVKSIQQALVKKGLLDAKDVIGEFGPKTEAALLKAGFFKLIDENTFDKITSGETKTPSNETLPPVLIDAVKFADALHKAAVAKNFNSAMTLLNLMKTTADYSAVSEKFKAYFLRGVRQTLVTGMLNSFVDPTQKDAIRKAFTDMGLKYDGTKFSLSGLGWIPSGKQIITTQRVIIESKRTGEKIVLPKHTVLGTKEVQLKDKMYFKPFKSKEVFSVHKNHIKQFN